MLRKPYHGSVISQQDGSGYPEDFRGEDNLKVFVIRHGKVDFSWSRSCTSGDFDKECKAYDTSPIRKENIRFPETKCQKIYVSTLSRSRETAKEIFGEKEFMESKLIHEVPLRSAFDTTKKLPLWFWNTAGRLQWFVNSKRQPEGRYQTRKRAKQFVKRLCIENEDCAIVTHGFYMHMLIKEMKRAGFTIEKNALHYKNGQAIVCRK